MSVWTETGLCLADAKRFASSVAVWLGVIVALGVLLGVVAMWIRRRVMTPTDDLAPLGFTLKDLRAMHASGQLTDEELAAAEAKSLARTRSIYLGDTAATPEEPEDIGHLSSGDEDDPAGGPENPSDPSDKKPEGER
ncbi:MAG: hypothetical protein ACPGYV_07615 [Phycisphaeraceae bacterium]